MVLFTQWAKNRSRQLSSSIFCHLLYGQGIKRDYLAAFLPFTLWARNKTFIIAVLLYVRILNDRCDVWLCWVLFLVLPVLSIWRTLSYQTRGKLDIRLIFVRCGRLNTCTKQTKQDEECLNNECQIISI